MDEIARDDLKIGVKTLYIGFVMTSASFILRSLIGSGADFLIAICAIGVCVMLVGFIFVLGAIVTA